MYLFEYIAVTDILKPFIFPVFLTYFLVLIRFRVLRLLSMNLVLEQATGLSSYLVHLMKPKLRRAFSKHLSLMVHHDISPHRSLSRSYVTF